MEDRLIKGISHLAFNVADMDRAVDFYCNVLGLEKIFDIVVPADIAERMPGHPAAVFAGKPAITYLQVSPGEYIELFYPRPDTDMNSGGPNYDRIGYAHLSLVTDDIHKAAEVLKSKGIKLDTEISMGADNTWQFWIKDPDGNRIELMQYTDKSYQVVHMKK